MLSRCGASATHEREGEAHWKRSRGDRILIAQPAYPMHLGFGPDAAAQEDGCPCA